ncbi:unnamed protein product, partial [Mesorhabditis spiculigera]
MGRPLLVFVFVALLAAVAAKEAVKPPPAPYAPECRIDEPDLFKEADPSQVPWFTIDLDAPAKTRYAQIARVYKDQIPPVLNVLRQMVAMIVGDLPLFEVLESFFRDAFEGGRYPQPYRDEIQGIADASGVPVEQIAMMNVFYELSRYCTSIVAEDATGGMWHGRNLDFGQLFIWDVKDQSWGLTEALKKVTINLNFIKNGKLMYKGTTFAGHTGIITGMRMGEFTLSMNAKMVPDIAQLMEWLTGDVKDVHFAMWVDRETMEKANNFEEARAYLSTVEQMTGCYYILGGNKPGQGSIIIRNATAMYEEPKLHDGDNDWFVLQTNYDPEQEPLWVDDRRTGGNACMNKLGKDRVSLETLYKVLKSKTTLNKTTVHTVIMSITHGIYQTYIQTCENPCWPF